MQWHEIFPWWGWTLIVVGFVISIALNFGWWVSGHSGGSRGETPAALPLLYLAVVVGYVLWRVNT